ncbi:hypothetical protein HF325_004618 [Metschnikowia pulcherrima]|uniref:Major facilitator superfamily (MFS) profile domain-containing protein n=1 Tax=Metschnikowia pulcherrima TaxID=27326 RepID=A0A8H7GQU6_9ASCO|nr:hypothetical protein HF325_004618 [Metschnikowia pulcherrima]
MVCFTVALGSAIVTGDLEKPAKYFKVSQEVIILSTVTVFVLGFGFGPLVFAPASEEVGRKPIYAATLGLLSSSSFHNIGTMLVCRLIDGLAFSAPMCLIGGSLADIWDAKERGLAMAVFSAAPFLGPVDLLDILIVAGFFYVIFIAVVPETHHNTLLKKRSKFLRKTTGDDSYKALCELQVRSQVEVFKTSMTRPFLLLSEVIVFLITIYMSVCYGLLYMFFFAYPVVYMEGKAGPRQRQESCLFQLVWVLLRRVPSLLLSTMITTDAHSLIEIEVNYLLQNSD